MDNTEKGFISSPEVSFKEGKVFDAILNIMGELNVPRNGVEIDKETGEVKYTYIQIQDLRASLNPLLLKNKCMIRRIGSKNFRDRKQNKFGTWMNVDVVESTFMIQSLEDGSYITATGRGEGTDWGSSSVTLANADAFKDFVGTTFCLVTDSMDEEDSNSTEPSKKTRKRKPKADKVEETANTEDSKSEPEIVGAVKITAPELELPVLKEVANATPVDINECGEEVELPKQAYDENVKFNEPISAEPIEPQERKEPELEKEQEEPIAEQEAQEVVPEVEATEEQLSSDEEIKKYADVICPIANKFVNGKTFEQICEMAIANSNEAEIAARNCVMYVAAHSERFNEKAPEFASACILAVQKFNLQAA